jgi:hypothetical protein
VNQLVLSGTATLVLSRTKSSCYRGPKLSLSVCFSALSSRSNFTNQKSFGFLLTDQAESRIGGVRQQRTVGPACLYKPHTLFTGFQAHGSESKLQGAAV